MQQLHWVCLNPIHILQVKDLLKVDLYCRILVWVSFYHMNLLEEVRKEFQDRSIIESCLYLPLIVRFLYIVLFEIIESSQALEQRGDETVVGLVDQPKNSSIVILFLQKPIFTKPFHIDIVNHYSLLLVHIFFLIDDPNKAIVVFNGYEIKVSKLVLIFLKLHHIYVVLHRYVLEQLPLLKKVVLELILDILILSLHLINIGSHRFDEVLELVV